MKTTFIKALLSSIALIVAWPMLPVGETAEAKSTGPLTMQEGKGLYAHSYRRHRRYRNWRHRRHYRDRWFWY